MVPIRRLGRADAELCGDLVDELEADARALVEVAGHDVVVLGPVRGFVTASLRNYLDYWLREYKRQGS